MTRRTLSLGLGALLLTAAPAGADDLMPPEKVEESIAQQLGVEVLRVTADADDPTHYRVVVMVPPGDSNAAFLVATLVVDARTGVLVSQFRHNRHGYDLAPGGFSNFEVDPDAQRSNSFRTP